MSKRFSGLVPIILLSLVPTLLIWLPFLLRLESFWTIPLPTAGMATIVANYDGPLYLVVAKTLYKADLIKSMFQFTLPTEYYAAHFPLFPLLIKLFAPLFGHIYSMLLVSISSSVLALYFFFKLAADTVNKKSALWLTTIFALLPARWLIVRSVGSAEPLFIASIIASIYFFRKKQYVFAGIWGALAQLTKSPGILLFVAYAAAIVFPHLRYLATHSFSGWVEKLQLKKVYPLLLIPLALILLFAFYGYAMGDFFAYFNSGDNRHIFFPPFTIFNYSAPWVGTFWLEEILFVYLIGALGIAKLFEQKKEIMAWFAGIFFASILFVAHRDILRYALPVVPFLIIAFADTLNKKAFKYVFALIVIPSYLFALTYISQNVMPISNWTPFL